MAMELDEIALEQIDPGNDLFQISEELDSPPLLDALRKTGQLNPVILLAQEPRHAIVCGFRRIRALAALGISTVIARVISEQNFDRLRIFDLALRDNCSHRQLDPLEAARALSKLKTIWRVSEEKLINEYLPLMGLKPHRNILCFHISLDAAHPELRRRLADGALTPGGMDNLVREPRDVQGRVASFLSGIRLSASLQRKVFALLQDLSVMNGAALDAPLAAPEIEAIKKNAACSPFQKGEQVHDALYRMRYPSLLRAREQFLDRKKRLALPGSVRIKPHPFFETNEIRVEFTVSSAEDFRKIAAALHEAGMSRDVDGLFLEPNADTPQRHGTL
ncbi:MAG TPA: ParB N-terminal domain-containing protein [Acidobacteriota bacterium]|nr:ParB N-terminal domain-containing protein [Acidobacteriota bacterium]